MKRSHTSIIAQQLRNAGLKVVKVTQPDLDTDGDIELELNYSVQVGYGYMMLNEALYDEHGELNALRHVQPNATVESITTHMLAIPSIPVRVC